MVVPTKGPVKFINKIVKTFGYKEAFVASKNFR